MIVPNTDVYLLKVPLEIDDTNQLTFASTTAQYNYFSSLPKLALDNYTYQRKDGVLRVGELVDDIMEYNYVMYRNTNYSNKWFYAFITGMEYLNDNVTAVSIKSDVFQCWQFDLTYKPTFVEREHTNNDALGANTVPEDLDTGEMIVASETTMWDVFDDKYHSDENFPRIVEIMAVTCMPDGQSPMLYGSNLDHMMNGLYQGLFFMVFTNHEQLTKALNEYDQEGRADAVYSVCEAYRSLFDSTTFDTSVNYPFHGDTKFSFYIPTESKGGDTCLMGTASVEYPNTVVSGRYIPTYDGYQCKNMKMLTYPFCYIRMSNNAGGEAIYRFEDFTLGNSTPNDNARAYFKAFGSISVSPNYKIAPCNYKKNYHTFANKEESYNYGLTGQKLPACSWISDYFTNWITQNGVNLITGGVTDTASAGMSALHAIATASKPVYAQVGVVGAGVSLAANIANTMADIYTHSRVPDQVKGDANTGDLNYSTGYTGWTAQVMCLRNEYAQRIDQFLTCFGYKTNKVKVPNITGRRNWNYVKTTSCYIEADIPQDDLLEIKSMFDKGITLWHNPSTFADYSQANDII